MNALELTETVCDLAAMIARTLGPGFAAPVYAQALRLELEGANLRYRDDVEIDIRYRSHRVGSFRIEMLVKDRLMLEVRAGEKTPGGDDDEEEARLANRLSVSGLEAGLLLNFGCAGVEARRCFRDEKDDVIRATSGGFPALQSG